LLGSRSLHNIALHTVYINAKAICRNKPVLKQSFGFADPPFMPHQLPLPEGCIRLLEVSTSSLADTIDCRTTPHLLEKAPSYTAISYACGSRPGTSRVRLNGHDWFVRKNLWRLLHQYVSIPTTRSGWLWIDAVCVNQEDDRERKHQVKLMASIYSSAARVVVWLGPSYGDSNMAMAKLTDARHSIRRLNKASWSLAMSGLCARAY
jgi:hypothetical protein